MKLMIVDDSEIISKRLKELLQDIDGLEIGALIGDGIDATSMYSKLNPDIIILDLMIPRMNGLDVLKYVRSKSKSVVIIILTNYDQAYFRERCADIGADYFLDKSSDFEKVYEICDGLTHPSKKNNTDYMLLHGVNVKNNRTQK